MDYEVCRKVWEAQVAVQFTIQGENNSLPFYTMLPRCSYFALAMPKVVNFFANRDDGEKIELEKVWLEANGIPLKTYLPIGVLFDLHNSDSETTWNVTVRTSTPPTGYIPIDRDTMEAMFIQSVKEADYLKRKAETINQMQKDEHNQLWNSIANNHFDDFWSVNKKLMDTSDKNFEYIPLRIYEKNKPFRQTLVTSEDESGGLRTIVNAVMDVVGQAERPKTQIRLISHGIPLPFDTPLIFAAKNLSYPDNFVHIVLI